MDTQVLVDALGTGLDPGAAKESTYDLAPIGFWSEEGTEWALRMVAKDRRLQTWSYTPPLEGSAAVCLGEWHCLESTLDVAE